MTDPVVVYTGLETCAKCNAPATEIVTGFDAEKNLLQLECKRCSYKWYVLPQDNPPA